MTHNQESTETEETTDLVDFVAQLDEQERIAKEEFPYDTSYCSVKTWSPLNQIIFSCKTCFLETGEPRGVCYGCSVSCHTRHDLIELNYRRNFMCDCREKCQLVSRNVIQDLKVKNKYEKLDNFNGIFCYCKMEHKPDEETRIMVQCLVCEDWFHDSCVQEDDIPKEDDFDDFLCLECCKTDLLSCYLDCSFSNNDYDSGLICCQRPKKRKSETLSDISIQKGRFLPLKWRSKLCRCDTCLFQMKGSSLEFLLEKEVHFTHPADLMIDQSTLQLGMKALNRIDRVVALDSIQKFNSLKEALSVYLQSFAENGQIVTKQDITKFFETHSKS